MLTLTIIAIGYCIYYFRRLKKSINFLIEIRSKYTTCNEALLGQKASNSNLSKELNRVTSMRDNLEQQNSELKQFFRNWLTLTDSKKEIEIIALIKYLDKNENELIQKRRQ